MDIAISGYLDMRLLEKFLIHVPDTHINLRDHYTGNTLLHHAVANLDADAILKILQKGADVTLVNSTSSYDYNDDRCTQDRTSVLPVEVAIQSNRSESIIICMFLLG